MVVVVAVMARRMPHCSICTHYLSQKLVNTEHSLWVEDFRIGDSDYAPKCPVNYLSTKTSSMNRAPHHTVHTHGQTELTHEDRKTDVGVKMARVPDQTLEDPLAAT